jgi:hypothetical protein
VKDVVAITEEHAVAGLLGRSLTEPAHRKIDWLIARVDTLSLEPDFELDGDLFERYSHLPLS